MENKQNTFQQLGNSLQKTYQRFFDIEPAPIHTEQTVGVPMPISQIQLFIDQAFDRHYKIELTTVVNQGAKYECIEGSFVQKIDNNKYLFKVKKHNIFKIITTTEIHDLKKIA